jgi:probable rRNA maturation factor
MPDGEPGLRVDIADDRGRRLAVPGLAAWLRRVAPARAKGIVSVAVVSDARIRALNREYRRKDYATDVLSFPATHDSRLPTLDSRLSTLDYRLSTLDYRFPNPQSPIPNPPQFLGDIVIARGVARRQARAARHSERTELKILALHGLLHLLGYDHEQDDGRMSRLERRLRRRGGLREGLIERARPRRRARSEPVQRRARR